MGRVTSALLVWVVLSACFAAAPRPGPPTPRLVTLDVEEIPLSDLLTYFRQEHDAHIELAEELRGFHQLPFQPVTVTLRDCPLGEAIERVVELGGCAVEWEGDGWLVRSRSAADD